MEESITPRSAAPVAGTGLISAIRVARVLTHLFFYLCLPSILVSAGARSGVPSLVCVGGFLVSYFSWVALVLFGCMNFSLSAMLWFVVSLGACIGLLMSGEEALMGFGALGLLVMVFATVIPVSRHDPTTPKVKSARKTPTVLLFIALPFICLVLLMFGGILAIVSTAGWALLSIGIMISRGPHGTPEGRAFEGRR